ISDVCGLTPPYPPPWQSALSLHRPMIDDADDARVDGGFAGVEGKRRLFAAHEEHFFAHAGAHRVDGHERPADGLALRGQRLHEEQRETHEIGILAGQDDVANYTG